MSPGKKMFASLIFSTAFLILQTIAVAQTCCSGGVPLSGNLGLPPADGKTLQFSLNYDGNVLKTLQFEQERLDDDSRIRRTHSILLETGYSFTARFSVDAFFSWVRQERVVRQFGNSDVTATQGVGDAVFLVKYRLWSVPGNTTTATAGVGVKAPLGASDLTRGDGRPIIADLQPGSGAWDGIFWGQVTHATSFRPSLSLIGTVSYSLKGKNDQYLGNEVYQFGNEFQLLAGLSDRIVLGATMLDPSLTFRFRHQANDRLNDIDFPNTGGSWLFVSPGLQWWPHSELSIQGNVELPVFARVTGTQLTPTFRVNAGIYYRLSFAKSVAIQSIQP